MSSIELIVSTTNLKIAEKYGKYYIFFSDVRNELYNVNITAETILYSFEIRDSCTRGVVVSVIFEVNTNKARIESKHD